MYARSKRLERWFARHPNVTIVFVAALAVGMAGYAAVVAMRDLDGTARAVALLALLVGLAVGAGAVALSHHAAFVRHWEVGEFERRLVQATYGVSALAAILLFKHRFGATAREAAAGFVFLIALWLAPPAVTGRRIRKSDPQLADELVERSHEVLRG